MANLPNKIIGEIFDIPEEQKIREETLSFHALNQFGYCDSSPRSYMASLHMSQSLVLPHGDEKIIQSGLDHQFGENTFSIKIEEDCYFRGVVERYKSINDNEEPIEILVFVETVSGQFDVYSIPHYFSLQQPFGFEYKTDKQALLSLPLGTLLKEGTVLADSPSVKKNSGLGLGVNANIALVTIPGTAQDGVIMSESMARKLSYKIFETRTIEFGSNKYPLNIYGDDNEYRGFPEIGEFINEDSLLAVLRETNDSMNLCLTSKNDLKNFDTNLDHCVYVKSPGKIVQNEYGTFKSGRVVDIKAWKNPKAKKNNIFPNTLGKTIEHVNKLTYFYQDVYKFYKENIEKNARPMNKREDGSLNISPRLNSLIIEAMRGVYGDDRKILLSHRYTPLDVYRIEFTIEHYISPQLGHKISDFNGGKGVIVQILPDDMMPYTKDGVRADIVMDPTSLTSRMNLGRSYEIYFNTTIRHVRKMIRDMLTTNPDDKDKAWKIVLEFLKIIDTEQYAEYKKATLEERDEVLKEIMEDEFYILYRISSKKKPHVLAQELEKSKFKPLKESIYIPTENGTIETYASMYIGPLYTILLAKVPDEGLTAVASGKTNNFGLPSGSIQRKDGLPFPVKANKILSETEGRHYVANGSLKLLAEIKDRANSKDTHKFMYRSILESETPGFSQNLVDRTKQPYGTDISLKILHSIINVAGLEIYYKPDPEDGYNELCDPRIGFTKK